MSLYSINSETHEVHNLNPPFSCPYLPDVNGKEFGFSDSIRQAVEYAQLSFDYLADPCYFCCLRERAFGFLLLKLLYHHKLRSSHDYR